MNLNWSNFKFRRHLRPGDAGYITYLHGILYDREYGYDETFEAYVASGIGDFVQKFDIEKDFVLIAEADDRIIGFVATAGITHTEAQLHWYIVHPDFRGLGLGNKLMTEALAFCRERGYKRVFLWTTSELDAALHIYRKAGFIKTEEKTHKIWGKVLTEERYQLDLQ